MLNLVCGRTVEVLNASQQLYGSLIASGQTADADAVVANAAKYYNLPTAVVKSNMDSHELVFHH